MRDAEQYTREIITTWHMSAESQRSRQGNATFLRSTIHIFSNSGCFTELEQKISMTGF